MVRDEETAPLLQDPDAEPNGSPSEITPPHIYTRITSIIQEPLTPLTELLLVVSLILLLLTSIFVGLYSGAQYNLDLERGDDGPKGTEIVTVTFTQTYSQTQTYVSTSTSTTVETSTAVPSPVPSPPPVEELCFAPHCVILSASILSSIDNTQDPCENFYDFANGGWINSHPLPADKGSFGIFNALSQKNQQLLRKILESNYTLPSLPTMTSFPPNAPSYDDQILRKLRGLYASCMDEDTLNEIGEKPLLELARTVRQLYRGESLDVEGGGKNFSEEGLTASVAFLHSRGINVLFDMYTEGDRGVDPNYMALWFSQPSLGLPSKEYYMENSTRELYIDVIQRLLLTLAEKNVTKSHTRQEVLLDSTQESIWPPWPWPPWGGDDDDGKDDESRNSTRELAEGVVNFESRLANASLDLDILYQDPVATYNRLPLTFLTTSLHQIHFPDYLSTFSPRSFPAHVIVTYPSYLSSLSHILNTTSPSVVEAYLVATSALQLAPFLGTKTKAWKAVRRLEEVLGGIKKGARGDREEECVKRVEEGMGFAAGRYFVRESFGSGSKEKGTKVIQDIIRSFKESLGRIEWMDEESAEAAAEKADNIGVKVGFPLSPDTQDAQSIAGYYRLVKISEDQFFQNMIQTRISDQFKMWSKLGQQRDPESFEMYPSMVNAYFNPPANEIVFPAGILQPPFFSHDWPSYLSYGAFGMVAAHELTHAFDSAGRMYNQQGKLEQWWSNFTSEGFQVRQDCIVKQFSDYTVDDGKGGVVHVNGNLTSGENIGDSGLIQAYRAWKAQYSTSLRSGNEFLLPGLNYTRDQLFFIAFGRIWGSNIKPASAVKRVRTDPHSPNRYRVDGTVYNMPEFAEAFSCSSNAKLNPPSEKRCMFW